MVATRVIEHERDVFHGRWEKSGLTEHAKNCNEVFDFESVKTLATEGNYRKRKIREALEIRRNETGPRQALATNKDRGNVLKTETWNFPLPKIKLLNQSLLSTSLTSIIAEKTVCNVF